jgi:hypothetical protein
MGLSATVVVAKFPLLPQPSLVSVERSAALSVRGIGELSFCKIYRDSCC